MNLFVGALVVVPGCAGCAACANERARLAGVLVVGLLIAAGQQHAVLRVSFTIGFPALPVSGPIRAQALLVVLVLICASGIWLSRPHPWLQAIWSRAFKNIPAHHLFIGLVVLQTLDLLRGTQQIKVNYSFSRIYHFSGAFPFEGILVKQLREAGLLEKFQPPPRVCVPRQLVPANNAMIHRYSNFDADFSLFLRRDWDYLHRMLDLQPSELINTHISDQAYQRAPFPYPDLAFSAGFDPTNGTLAIATNTPARAFLVYATKVMPDYDTILMLLSGGHDIHQSALLEKPLANPLSPDNKQPATLAHIRRFEPDSILVDVDAKESALLVLAEAWYPGWRAEIDGQVSDCVPVNIWMRGVPVPAGRHEVRVYFHQDYLLPGAIISALSAGLLLAVLIWPGGLTKPRGS